MMNTQNAITVNNDSSDKINELVEVSRNLLLSTGNITSVVSAHEKALNDHATEIEGIKVDVSDLNAWKDERQQNEKISTDQGKVIKRAVNDRVRKLLKMKKKNSRLTLESKRIYAVYGHLFYQRAYGDLNDRFNASEYRDIRAVDYDDALNFAKTWEPQDGIEGLKADAEESWEVNHPDGPTAKEFLGILF